MSSPELAQLFDRYVVVDWSARNSPATGSDSIWIAELADGRPRLTNPSTRRQAARQLGEILDRHRDERVLIGCDASLGYPAGTAGALGLMGRPWDATWGLVAELSSDDERNRNNRFEVAAELNRRIGSSPGPFWGCPPARVGPHLTATKPPDGPLAQYRLAEHQLRQAGRYPASCWHLLGVGTVGSQTLTLLPILAELRAERGDRMEVWPFTTGLAAASVDRGVAVVAEVWPTMFPFAATGDHDPGFRSAWVKDARQVEATASALRAADLSGELAAWMAPALSGADEAAVVNEEGWVLGVVAPVPV